MECAVWEPMFFSQVPVAYRPSACLLPSGQMLVSLSSVCVVAPIFPLGFHQNETSEEHLIFDNLHLLMKTFCRKQKYSICLCYQLVVPITNTSTPKPYNSCRNLFDSEGLLKCLEEQTLLRYYSSLIKSMG